MQIIVIVSAEALAEQIEQTYLHHGSMKIKQAILVCLHPIEVPSDAEKLVEKIRDTEYARYADTGNQYIKHILTDSDAAVLIEGLRRKVPRAMLDEIWLIGNRSKPGQKEVDNAEIAEKYGYRAE